MANLDFCKGAVHRAIHSIMHIIEDHTQQQEVPKRFAASRLVEGDALIAQRLAIHESDLHIIEHIVQQMEEELDTDREAAMADMRYSFIEALVSQCVYKQRETLEQATQSEAGPLADAQVSWHPDLSGHHVADLLSDLRPDRRYAADASGSGRSTAGSTGWMACWSVWQVSDWLHDLLINGVCAGVGSVLSFLPLIVTLFFFLSLLEDSGYMARVAYIMDKALRKIGLSGKSFVPMLIGFGCSVPAIMATRTLSSERDRKMTIILTPFMSCSAKLPIYGMITAAFFPAILPPWSCWRSMCWASWSPSCPDCS